MMYRQYAYRVAQCGGIGSLLASLCAICLKCTNATEGEMAVFGAFEIMVTALASLPIGFIFGILFALTVNTGFLMRAPIESEEPALGGGYMIHGYGYISKSMLYFRVWLRWVVLTSVGWCAGVIAVHLLSALVGQKLLQSMSIVPLDVNLITGFWMGLAVSLAQKVAVRPWMRLSLRWVWGAVIAIGSPFALIGFLLRAPDIWLIPGVTVGGALCGLLQVPALRPHVSRVYWWVFASMVSWGLAWYVLRTGGLAGSILSPIVLGGITGLFFIRLRKPPNTVKTVEGDREEYRTRDDTERNAVSCNLLRGLLL